MAQIPRTSPAVVISTYNRPRALNRVLLALSRQTVRPSQILIGDDGSGPETRGLICQWIDRGLPVEHVWHEDSGYRKTIIMNQAFSKVRSALTIFMDGDCIPGPKFVEDHLNLSEPGFILAGPRILASQGYTEQLEGNQQIDFFHQATARVLSQRMSGSINRLAPLIRLPDGAWRRAKPKKWELVRGCNFSVESKHVWAVDGFEESLYGWGPDDSDIAVRLLNLGLSIKSGRFACPVLHLWHKEESRHGLTKNREYLQNALSEGRVKAVRGLSSHDLKAPVETY
jgi:hypothetical protein